MFEEVIEVLNEINSHAKNDDALIWYPSFIKQKEVDLKGYEKQPSSSTLFEYVLIKQNGGGITGDCFSGEMLYPFKEWFIKVHYEC